jgi:hypothetical protein
MKLNKLFLLGLFLVSGNIFSQDDLVLESFSGTRVLSNHSVELLPKRSLEFIVAHKFGDIAGNGGGVSTFYGLDNLSDVRIAFEYGITDKFNIGLGRCKGDGQVTGLVDGFAKYKILQQKKVGMPINMVFVSSLVLPYKKAVDDLTQIASYPDFLNRFTFTNQLLISRKFSDRFVAQVNFGYNHRNLVNTYDQNGVLFAGIAGRARITKTLGFLVEYNHVLNRPNTEINNYKNPLSVGIELITGGHSFIINFSNARALNENLFISSNTADWLDGQWRFGFSINRRFKL